MENIKEFIITWLDILKGLTGLEYEILKTTEYKMLIKLTIDLKTYFIEVTQQ